jgi:RNase adapter protein RapZ
MEVVIVTGLSGAGKSQAMNCLEDLGYYCIDNMPPELISNFISLEAQNKISIDKAAFVIDVRGGDFFEDLNHVLNDLKKESKDFKVLFLEASDNVLISRFKETRRTHPLNRGGTNSAAIKEEREKLKNVRDKADFIIDTSDLKTSMLNEELKKLLLTDKDKDTFRITVQSFGYKHGMSLDADIVFDVRFIPNPYYIASMKKLSGNNKKVKEYVLKFDVTKSFLKSVDSLINDLIPSFRKEGKSHLVIAFGCTGGQHRSVAIANEFSGMLLEEGKNVSTNHRDLAKASCSRHGN